MTQQTPISYIAKHTFTPEEKEQKLQQMLNAMRIKAEIEDELKTTKSTYKAKIDSREAEIKLMSNLLNAGCEDRTVQAIVTMAFNDGRKYFHEVGTGRRVGEEPLSAADYQTQMNLEEANIKANNEAADQLIINGGFVEVNKEIVADKPPEDGVGDKKSAFTIVPVDSLPIGFEEMEEEETKESVKGGIEASEPEEVKEDDEFDFGDDDEIDDNPF